MKIIFCKPFGINCPGGWIGGINISLIRKKSLLTLAEQSGISFDEAKNNHLFCGYEAIFINGDWFPVLFIPCGGAGQVCSRRLQLVHEGEFGISAGAAHYFGDLNPDYHFNSPKPAIGIFFRKQFGNYIAVRVAGHFAQLGYSDVYNTQNEFDTGET